MIIFGVNFGMYILLWVDGMRFVECIWEIIDSYDVGVDFVFFSNCLRGLFDYFIKINNGMFIDV